MIAMPTVGLDQCLVLRVDAIGTGAIALVMIAGAAPLADLFDTPLALMFGAGLVLVPYVTLLHWLADQHTQPVRMTRLAIGANIVWALGAITLLLTETINPNVPGTAFVLMHAIASLVVADLLVFTRRKPLE